MVTTGGNLSEERFPPDLFLKTSASFLAGTNNFIKKGAVAAPTKKKTPDTPKR